jgi:hypothetical protein
MACRHKFQELLDLEWINFEPTTLIVGTFNPSWPTENNNSEWFYGRTHDINGNQNNNFWEVLPRLYGSNSLINSNADVWKRFCLDNRIAITDIINSVNDADEQNDNHQRMMGSFKDDDLSESFYDFEYTNIVGILRRYPTIRHIYITRSISQTYWKNIFYPTKKYCESFGVNLIPLITPSGYAYIQQGTHNKQNPNNRLNLQDYILMRWREVWHQIK